MPIHQADMQVLWKDYENWLAEHWPDGLSRLQGPATDAQMTDLETALRVKLPDDLIAFLKIHNGQSEYGPLLSGWYFLSVEEILEQWLIWAELVDAGEFDDYRSEPQAGIRNDWYNRKWIPFTHDGAGNHLCVDLDPAADGQHGQVITMWHDSPDREQQARSFHAFFASYVQAVLAGQYAYGEDYDGIVAVGDL
ncbi:MULTISPECIES: SMI1/KNR4 family protein [unclassified Massilia]|uniref:SMI1/KNR4 family protein n=1 Tax=unclassified Massilia TaxID=2609279 RepID=UPI0017842EDD|nr:MULTISPECIES: SMI1/KNR4 family protein [unclassified Massilia]MBD8529784.1 SMI1/KNR4 family protein [Massilia sp. CFBP 13647]MBD8672204.1 SMI1/KNR4 family protein [Massilia sp. CFBP 13721]